MAWTQDPETGEWVLTEEAVFEPTPRLAATHPTPTPSTQPAPIDDGAAFPEDRTYADRLPTGPMAPLYQNEDDAIVTRWEREVRARGNEVRVTPVGTFEVDANGRIVSEAPTPYRTV